MNEVKEKSLVHIHTCLYVNEYKCDERSKNAAERKIMMRKEQKNVYVYV